MLLSNPQDVVEKFRLLPFHVPPARLYNKDYRSGVMTYLSAPVIDRTQTLQNVGFSNIKIFDPIPTDLSYPGEFAEIVDATAREIVERSKALNLPVAVLYSGGLDSTCVAASLLKAGQPITIVGSTPSIEENPSFYNNVLENNPLVTLMIGNPLMEFRSRSEDYIWVTGECGAHLMGTVNWTKYGGRDDAVEDFVEADDIAASIFRNPEPFFNIPENIRPTLNTILEVAPMELKTNYDAQWWAIFALKWQFVVFRTQMWAGKVCPNMFNFFMTQRFQRWAMVNDVSVKCPDFNWRNYKMPIRDYIYNFFPDRSSSYDLPKRPSFGRTYVRLRSDESFIMADPIKVGWLTLPARNNIEQTLLRIKS